jgi:hypothetical protein
MAGSQKRINIENAVKAAYQLGLMHGRHEAQAVLERDVACMKAANKHIMDIFLNEQAHSAVRLTLESATRILEAMEHHNLSRYTATLRKAITEARS